MDLEKVLSVSGKSGLFVLVSQSRNGAIVEGMEDKKRFPVLQVNKLSALKDIAIYTHEEEVPLSEVYQRMAKKENYGEAISHKASPEELKAYVEEVLPNIDHERVYHSDLKKLVQWYNLLVQNGYVVEESEKPEQTEEIKESSGKGE